MLKDTIFNRRTTRKYKGGPVPHDLLENLLMHASMGPSAGNAHPIEFIVVEDPETKAKLAAVEKFGTAYVKDAPTLIVLIGDTETSRTWVEEGAIAAAYLGLLLEEEGYSSSWIHLHGLTTPEKEDTESYVRNLLGIPEKYGVLCMLPVGEKDERTKRRKEFPMGEKMHMEKF